MLQVAVGHSNDPDSRYAVAEVLEQCHNSLAGNQPQAGILFAAIDFDHSLDSPRNQPCFSRNCSDWWHY